MPQGTVDAESGDYMPSRRPLALIALGSNLSGGGVSLGMTLRKAIFRLGESAGMIRSTSRFYRTPAFPPGSGPDFLNAAIALETDCGPSELMTILHRIEAEFGRDRSVRWGPRTLDLDLIALGDIVAPDRQTYLHWAELPVKEQQEVAPDALILPHPRLQERAFVLVPLADVAPDWVHPVTGDTVRALLEALPSELKEEVAAL